METTKNYLAALRKQKHEINGELRIVIYARLSKNRSGLSTNTTIQVNECLEEAQYYAKDQRLKLIVVAVFEENDVSASKYSKKPRPDYLALIELIKGNQVDIVFATEPERLCRRPREMDDLIDLAETTSFGCLYFTSDDVFDLRKSNGIARARDSVTKAERESNKISERIKRTLNERASQGHSHGGRRPYGFKKGGHEHEETEIPILHKMGEQLANKVSCREVCYWANENGYLTAEGKLWEPVSIHNMFRRPRYIGVRVHHGNEYPAQWPAVFERELWDKIQLNLDLTADRFAGREHGRIYLLTGCIYCGKCGTALNGSPRVERGIKRYTYVCRTEGTKTRRHGCGGVCRSAEALDYWITEAVLDRLDSPKLGELLREGDIEDEKIRVLLEKRDAQQRRLDGLIDDYSTGLLNKQQLARAKTTAEKELGSIEREITSLNRRRSASGLIPVGQSLRAAWETNDHAWRRALIQLVVERIEVYPSVGPGPYFQLPDKRIRFDPSLVKVTWRV